MMTFVDMVENLETAYYKNRVNIDTDESRTFEDWLDTLTMSELVFRLRMHGDEEE